jgi:hypothetical protein
MHKRVIEARSRNHCFCRKEIIFTYFEGVSIALVVQHTKCMRLTVLLSVACLALPNFSTLSHK